MPAANPSTYKLQRSLWPQNAIYDQIIDMSPTLGVLPKDTNFYEKVRYIAVGTGSPQGVSPVFATAKGNKSASTAEEFALSPNTLYGLFSIDGQLMRRSKSNKAVIVKPMAREMKNTLNQMKRDLSAWVHGNGGGAFGQILTAGFSSAGQTFTLTNVKDARFFQKNMYITTSTTNGTSGSIKSGRLKIAGVNYTTGVITVSEATLATGIPNIAAADYVFREGVFGNVMSGMGIWNPTTAASGTFKGVDRTNDPELLGGWRFTTDTQGKSILASILFCAGVIFDNRGKPDLAILNTDDWGNLRNELIGAGSLVYTQVPASKIGKYQPGLSYDAIQIQGPGGMIRVLADPDAPAGLGRVTQRDTWTIASMGEMVHIIDSDRTEDAADANEWRFVSDIEMYNEAPLYTANFAI